MKIPTKKIALCAMFAAVYVALTFAFAWCSFGTVQFRVAEMLTVLPYCMPSSIVSLTVGCLISNLLSTLGPLDLIVGTAATFLGACLTALCRRWNLILLAPLPPVLTNAVMVSWLIVFQAGTVTWSAWFATALSVGFGQLVCCYGLGLPLLFLLKSRSTSLSEYLTFSSSKKLR